MNDSEANLSVSGFFGHHRSGSTWISKVCEAICAQLSLKFDRLHSPLQFDDDLEKYIRRKNLDFIAYTNAHFKYVRQLHGLRGFHVVRDPRDVLVSSYYSHRYSHPTQEWPALKKHRRILNQTGLIEGLLLQMEFMRGVFYQMNSWEFDAENIQEIRFESMIDAPVPTFKAVFQHLGLLEMIGTDTLVQIVDENCFERLSKGRSRGEKDVRSHYRSGCAGDWREHFTSAHEDRFKELYGPLLVKLGYGN